MEEKRHYAVVTGGTSGIGYELARLLANDHYNLVLVARDEDELRYVAKEFMREYGINVIPISRDLFDPENAFLVYREVIDRGIQTDILINDAGQGHYGQFVDTDIRRELAIIKLNVCSVVVLTKLFLKDMVEQRNGKILNLSSIASKAPGPWHSVYHATKAFVQSFTEAVHNEVKDSGVTVTALLPGVTATDFFNKADMLESKVVQEDKMDNAVTVAKDGYEALMKGDDMVISGMKNKMKVAMSNLVSDATAAEQMKKLQEPAE